MLLAYEITTPAHADFGNVQSELGIEEKGAVVLQVKDPNVKDNNNPRAANMPREKKAHVSGAGASPTTTLQSSHRVKGTPQERG